MTDLNLLVEPLLWYQDHFRSLDLVHAGGSCFVSSVLSSNENLSGLIKFQLGDFTVGWVNWDLDLSSILLIPLDLFNVDGPSSSVNGENFSGLALSTIFAAALLDSDGIALSDWDGSAIVFISKIFAQGAAHHLSLN